MTGLDNKTTYFFPQFYRPTNCCGLFIRFPFFNISLKLSMIHLLLPTSSFTKWNSELQSQSVTDFILSWKKSPYFFHPAFTVNNSHGNWKPTLFKLSILTLSWQISSYPSWSLHTVLVSIVYADSSVY